MGGLTERDLRNRYYQFYYNPEAREAYMENAVRPLCENVLQYYQDTIVVCDLTVENGSTEVDDDETAGITIRHRELPGKILPPLSPI